MKRGGFFIWKKCKRLRKFFEKNVLLNESFCLLLQSQNERERFTLKTI
jgi:hypothetical protein